MIQIGSALASSSRSGKRGRPVALRPIQLTQALEGEIRLIVRTVPAAWAEETKATILPAYEAALDRITRDDATGGLRFAMATTAGRLAYLVAALPARVEAWHRQRFATAVRAAGGPDLGPFMAPQDVADEVQIALDRSVALIQGLSDTMQRDVAHVIWMGASNQTPADEVGQQIAERIGIGRRRADFIARDQLATVNGELTRARHQRLGGEEYIWDTSRDERVRGNPQGLYPRARPSHFVREGRAFRWSAPPEGGHPGHAPGCRCRARPLIEV